MNAWVWARMVDRDGIARFVDPERAARVANLTLAETAYDLSSTAENRRRLVQLIYEGLISRAEGGERIDYDRPEYNYEEDLQTIRTPEEILVSPRQGTCLDLSLLFAGLCLHNGLLPLVILLDGHAFVAVNLNHSRTHDMASGWQSFGRRELVKIEAGEGLLSDSAEVAQLIGEGTYLPVECTGFAYTQKLPETLPEGRGRFMGYLPFAQAEAAGKAQLQYTQRAFRYAADIHYLQQKGVRPMSQDDQETTGGGDTFNIDSVSGESVAIGREAQSTVTKTTHVDKSSRNEGIQIIAKDNARLEVSGNVALGNITIGGMPHGSPDNQEELAQTIAALNEELQQLAATQAAEAQKLEKRVNNLLAAAKEEEPDEEVVAANGGLVLSAAKKLAAAATLATQVVPLAEKVVSLIEKLIG